MNKSIGSITATLLCASLAVQSPAQEKVSTSGEYRPGIRWTTLDVNSSKYDEYRDLRDGFFVDVLRLDILAPESGWLFDLGAEKALRDDQRVRVRLDHLASRLSIFIDHNKIPHNLSNKAMTPYIDRGRGLLTVPAPASILKDGNDTTGTPSLVPTTGQMAFNDALIAKYLETYLRPVSQRTDRERTTAGLSLHDVGPLDISLTYLNERRNGMQSTFGPIGDRPPRTLNVQIPEPVKYTTYEMMGDIGYTAPRFQLQLRYVLSIFENEIDVLRWENMFFAPDPGMDFVATVAGTPRNVSNFGLRSLAPDNVSHTVSLSSGFDLPFESRLSSTITFGSMRQNERLQPYSVSTLGGDATGDGLAWNDLDKLPRARADAEMQTLRVDLEYSVSPIAGLNVRPFLRYYDLDNKTPVAEWRYVSQDAAGTNGAVNYRNFRRNLAYAYNKVTAGVDVRQYVPFWRTTLGLGYARVGIKRDFREADTDEDKFEFSLRARPSRMLSVSAVLGYWNREGNGYNYNVTSQSYWYSFAQGAADVDNPQFLFANHPDLRKFDVSDRKRQELRVSVTSIAREDLDLTASYRYCKDDFESGVTPVAPLAGTTVPLPNPADANALTPGRQLGLLLDTRQAVSVFAHYVLSDRWTLTAFADREVAVSDLRGMVFNENQRREPSNPTIQTPTQLGPWTDPNRLYNAGTREVTNTVGFGLLHDVIPGTLRLQADFNLSGTTVDLSYSGYGSDPMFLGRDWETFQFGFNDPGTVRIDQYVFNASLEYKLFLNLALGLNYFYSRYSLTDWGQAPAGPWVEFVGSEFLWRDTSRDNRWGNRVVAMGSYLAPSYSAHVGYLTMTYTF